MPSSFSNKIRSYIKYLLQPLHPIRGGICVTYQRYTWCTWHHPSHSCHRPELRALWTGGTQKPRSCPTEASGMNCSLELAWRFGQCACMLWLHYFTKWLNNIFHFCCGIKVDSWYEFPQTVTLLQLSFDQPTRSILFTGRFIRMVNLSCDANKSAYSLGAKYGFWHYL